jgi:hypothetical protein
MEIVESNFEETRGKEWWKVALAFAKYDADFHWYRLNNDGLWLHKPGGLRIRDYDDSCRIIYNPETCNRGRYTEFVGFFMIRKISENEKLTIKDSFIQKILRRFLK